MELRQCIISVHAVALGLKLLGVSEGKEGIEAAERRGQSALLTVPPSAAVAIPNAATLLGLFTVIRLSLAGQRGTAGSWASAAAEGACNISRLKQEGHTMMDIVTESMKQPSSARHLDSQTNQSASSPRWLRHSALTIKTNFGRQPHTESWMKLLPRLLDEKKTWVGEVLCLCSRCLDGILSPPRPVVYLFFFQD